jgi:hypothetical protein
LRDGASWPTFSGLGSFELETPSPDGQPGEGVGAIRIFRTPRGRRQVENRELIVEAEPGRSYAYELLSGLPLDGYRATATLTPAAGGGTDIAWRSVFRPKIPGTGRLVRRNLGPFIQDLVTGLARAAERTPSST